MALRFDIAALGELLIDFTAAGESDSGARLFERNAGGAPANVAVGSARLGLRTAFIGKVGDDACGRFLRDTLVSERVDCAGLLTDPERATTLAFVDVDAHGERSDFSFAWRGSASDALTATEVSNDVIGASAVLHVGTLSLLSESSRSATLAAVGYAHDAGVHISCDVNYRAQLWGGEERFIRETLNLLPRVDLLKASEDEARLLGQNVYTPPLTVITRGADGADIIADGAVIHVDAAPVARVVDTTGAGDAFWAGFLYATRELGSRTLSEQELHEAGQFAARCAAFCIGRRGAIPALPTMEQLREPELRQSMK